MFEFNIIGDDSVATRRKFRPVIASENILMENPNNTLPTWLSNLGPRCSAVALSINEALNKV